MNVEVLSFILSVILVFLIIALVYIAIFENPKKLAIQMKIDNNPYLSKYIKAQRALDITEAFGYFTIGVLLALNVIPREYALIYLAPIVLLEKTLGFKIKKKYQP
ncbi:hypothetical protein [Isachenkonia alkalipeptolytica]|uniref:DUF3784 domain-containing protein n=1 Tax=Isachenkonia alkalipeptolytica TaxID=2565777 RepID=A0AA43XL25_9CLOT|nr:hypothetical protein [Isachenkonia alkalipeptolytica]NBG88239.1 hypothetical protein [Isachenkonia alkalipeptolytica]